MISLLVIEKETFVIFLQFNVLNGKYSQIGNIKLKILLHMKKKHLMIVITKL